MGLGAQSLRRGQVNRDAAERVAWLTRTVTERPLRRQSSPLTRHTALLPRDPASGLE